MEEKELLLWVEWGLIWAVMAPIGDLPVLPLVVVPSRFSLALAVGLGQAKVEEVPQELI